jgi:hypothetical protein
MIALGTAVTVTTPVGYDFASHVLGCTELGPVRYLVRLTDDSVPFWVPASMVSVAAVD